MSSLQFTKTSSQIVTNVLRQWKVDFGHICSDPLKEMFDDFLDNKILKLPHLRTYL